jgi:ABC-type transporter Mla subunit MlaD
MHIGKRELLLLVLFFVVLLIVAFVVVAELAYVNRTPPPRKETSQRYTMAWPQTSAAVQEEVVPKEGVEPSPRVNGTGF